ncbi:MAG: hypothetical protein E6I94_01965 [Chloroflexi bacterium]|nr:MAG: hypothetical protein E6I94_01965 [Chloroflexota bacterium]
MTRRDPMRRARLWRLAFLTSLVIGGAACGPSTPATPPAAASGSAAPSFPFYSPGPSGTPEAAEAVYSRIEGQVQQIRGLTAKASVTPQVLDEAGLKAALRTQFDQDNPPDQIAASQKLYEALGLLPSDESLKELYLKLLGAAVTGYYDPDRKSLFVISRSGGLGPVEQISFAHEFDHALQDQNFGLQKLRTSAADQSDRSLARLSLAEGDATLLMSDWAQQNFTLVQMLQFAQSALDPAQNAVVESMPTVLRDQLTFPYTRGLSFVESLRATGGWSAVDAAYAQPPDSSEQVMHPEKYVAHEAPVAVAFPADLAARLGGDWRVETQDTWGEFGLVEWLIAGGGVDADAAIAATEGWGGDRLVLASSGKSYAIAIQTAWDTPADAAEFSAAAKSALAAMSGSTALVENGAKGVTLFVGSDAASVRRLRGAVTGVG